mmetsp:Transcript_7393/g.13782  ORF Transcript_7393/g.13782 Transcript_7393/m.13782 type:complete len:799 (-) Transcript_7393:458-2854(-)
MSSSIVFPGNLSSPPDTMPIALPINLNNWSLNQDFNVQRAAQLAFIDFKLSSRKFAVKTLSIEACQSMDPKTGYAACYIAAKRSKVSMLLSSDRSINVLIQNEFMRKSSLRMPFINDSVNILPLASISSYPNFVRIVQSASSVSPHVVMIMDNFHYSKLNLVMNPILGTDTLNLMIGLFKVRNVESTLDPALIPLNYTDPTYFPKLAQNVKDTLIRPMSILGLDSDAGKVMAALYDAGLRAKDVIFNLPFIDFKQVLAAVSEKETDKIMEFQPSVMEIHYASFVSDYGIDLKLKLQQKFGEVYSSDCYAYDITAVSITALDSAIKRGVNWNDWEEMMRILRQLGLQGCSGYIHFSVENNDRTSIDMDFIQPRLQEGMIRSVQVVRTSVVGQFYNRYDDFQWYDGSSTTPSVYRLTYKDCPFPEEFKIDSKDSQYLTAWISFAAASFASIVSAVSLAFSVRPLHLKKMESKIALSTQDCLACIFTVCELFALDLMNPNLGVARQSLLLVYEGDLQENWLKEGRFFNLLLFAYTLAALSSVAIAVSAIYRFKALQIDIQQYAFWICRPCFVLLALTFMTTFDCSHAQSENRDPGLDDSFMDVDCHETCWFGKHLKHAVASAASFAVLLAISIPYSYDVTNLLDGMQIETCRFYLVVRMPVVVICMALYKSRLVISGLTHSAVYVVVLGLYASSLLRFGVVNIPTLNLIHNSLMWMLWVTAVAELFHYEVYDHFPLWFGLGASCIVAIAIRAVWLFRRLPKLLKRTNSVNTKVLFEFAFQFCRNNKPYTVINSGALSSHSE